MRSVNTSFTSHSYHFVVTVRTLKMYSVGHLQAHNTVSLATVTMLSIRSQMHSPFNWKPVPFGQPLLVCPAPRPWQLPTHSVCVSSASLDCTCEIPWYSGSLCVTYVTEHNALAVHPCCRQWQISLFFNIWNNIPSCICTDCLHPFIRRQTPRLFL